MAKIAKMPNLAIIDGFKGVVDFYVHDGQACARKWPRRASYPRSPAELATRIPFTWAAKNWKYLPAEIQDAFNRMAQGTNLTGRDTFLKSYINGASIIHL